MNSSHFIAQLLNQLHKLMIMTLSLLSQNLSWYPPKGNQLFCLSRIIQKISDQSKSNLCEEKPFLPDSTVSKNQSLIPSRRNKRIKIERPLQEKMDSLNIRFTTRDSLAEDAEKLEFFELVSEFIKKKDSKLLDTNIMQEMYNIYCDYKK